MAKLGLGFGLGLDLGFKVRAKVRPGSDRPELVGLVPIHIFAGARTTHMNFASSNAFQCRV